MTGLLCWRRWLSLSLTLPARQRPGRLRALSRTSSPGGPTGPWTNTPVRQPDSSVPGWMDPLSCPSPHLPAAAALLLGLTFLRCIGADWNSTAKNELKEALCADAKENCTDSLESEKRSHFSRCPNEYEHYCVKGRCRYVVEMKKPSCVCHHGYVGSRCELLDLYYLRGDRGQLVIIGLVVAVVAIIILIICTCACYHHCRRRRKEKKKEEHIETLNRDNGNVEDNVEGPVAPSVSMVDEANQTVLLHNETKNLTVRVQEHLVD